VRIGRLAIYGAAAVVLVVSALLVVVIARGLLRANQHISLCFDETDHDYIKDDKAREAACKEF
jgi:hypothetical protein